MVNQIEVNPRHQQSRRVSQLQEHGVLVEAWAPFGEGRQDMFSTPELVSIAQQHDATPAQLILAWLRGLCRLRECGMSIAQMKRFMDLALAGEETIPERIALLEGQRESLHASIATLEGALASIDAKQEYYREVLAGRGASCDPPE